MKKLLFLMLASVAAPALGATFSVSGWTAQAGQPARFVISRVSGTDPGYVSFRTDDGTAKARIDYAPYIGRVYFTRGQSSRSISPATYINSAKLGQTLSFRGTISVNGIAQATATAFIVEPPAPKPTSVPAQTPLPPANTGFILSPSLDGAAPIDTSAADDAALQPSWVSPCGGNIPCSAAPDVVGAMRFICQPGQVLPDDPIVFPGQPGASHLHQFYGNTLADAFSTYESLRKTGQSTCNRGVPDPAQRSAYWMPAMLDGAGNVVKPRFVSIYYKRRPASDPKCSLSSGDPKAEGNCIAVPNGLRFIMGYDMLTGKTPTGELYYNCQSPDAKNPIPGVIPGTYPNLNIALANCPAGALLGAVIKAPGCWDGKNLDTPNHRDHMAYPGYGDWGYLRCPPGFPYRVPDFTLGAWYPVAAGMHLSSDAMVPGAIAGTTFHADFFEAWSPKVKAMWTDNCINKMLNCSGGDLGNGQQLRNAQ